MQVHFRRITDSTHAVEAVRDDGTVDRVVLESKDFLLHDLAHYIFELEADLRHGVWGSVAAGGSLDGTGIDGSDVAIAERFAGPLQTLLRTGASATDIADALAAILPDLAGTGLAARLHERARRVLGHWNATGFGDTMTLEWPAEPFRHTSTPNDRDAHT